MKSYDFESEAKRLDGLADNARAMFNDTGLFWWSDEMDYYRGLAKKLRDLAWHYECLENEGIL